MPNRKRSLREFPFHTWQIFKWILSPLLIFLWIFSHNFTFDCLSLHLGLQKILAAVSMVREWNFSLLFWSMLQWMCDQFISLPYITTRKFDEDETKMKSFLVFSLYHFFSLSFSLLVLCGRGNFVSSPESGCFRQTLYRSKWKTFNLNTRLQ